MSYASTKIISSFVDIVIASLTNLYLIPTSQFFYISKFYMTTFQVEVHSPLSTAWADEQVERRLVAEIHTYGNYGHVQVC